MQVIADLHLHSRYSRAVSQNMTLSEISRWTKLKGISLTTTSDWTHPLWFKSIKEELVEVSLGVFTLKKRPNESYFMLSTEISSIYSQDGKTHRIHNLVFSPSIQTSEKIIKELNKQGCNLMSDGRPIIGLSSKELMELILGVDKNCFLIPCHVWTPWFSLYGSKSGFDSIDQCFGDYAKNIYAIETGLSSDPIMNWQIKELKGRSIVSFSDAHSGPKIGREATVFVSNNNEELKVSDINYEDIIGAFKQDKKSRLKIGFTIEFFPEEGKYHWSGHRSCNVRYNAKEVKEKGITCPNCRKPLTIGVENRVLDLSEKLLEEKDLIKVKNKAGLTFIYDKNKVHRPFVSIIPLLEVLLEINDHSPTRAQREYERVTNKATEFDILLRKNYDEIEKIGGEKLKQAIEIIRERKVFVDPGYDGVFGKVKIFNNKNEETNKENQQSLF